MGIVLSLIKIALAVFLGLSLLLYFRQDGMIFLGARLPSAMLDELRRSFPESEMHLTAPDGTPLHGWYLPAHGSRPAPLLIYFGGNAEDVSSILLDHHHFSNISLLLFNYRGYGLSQGRPSQKNLIGDALFLYDYFAALPEVDRERIILMGRSLGTCVAVELAARRKVERLVLISPFASLRALARKHFPWFPVGPFLRHPFDIIDHAPGITAPLLAIIAAEDRIVPPEHSRRLLAAWGGETRALVIAGADHNDLGPQREFWSAIETFIDGARNRRQAVHP